jgi:hypothetical protein
MEENRLKDPLTGELFIPKRVNQRFASAYNRNKFNNRMANDLRKERAIIYAPLNKTHKLIKKLMEGKNECTFTYDYLAGYGIQFNINSHVKTIDGKRYNCVFEFIMIVDAINKTITIKKDGRL